jgi:predicted HTH domain antitoxin
MQVIIDIPDTLAAQLSAAGRDPSRATLEALAVDGYRTRQLSEGEVRTMLGYKTRIQVHELLKEHGVYLNFSVEDLQQDIETSNRLFERSTAA